MLRRLLKFKINYWRRGDNVITSLQNNDENKKEKKREKTRKHEKQETEVVRKKKNGSDFSISILPQTNTREQVSVYVLCTRVKFFPFCFLNRFVIREQCRLSLFPSLLLLLSFQFFFFFGGGGEFRREMIIV